MANYNAKRPKSTSIRKREMRKPITSEEDYLERRAMKREIALENKRRSKTMERDVSRLLKGDRTLMSGAGRDKGDIKVPFTYRPGHYLVECKLTAGIVNDQPVIHLQQYWLEKMQDESISMGSLFPILVLKYMHTRGFYVLILEKNFNKIHPALENIREIDFTPDNPRRVGIKSCRLYHTQIVDTLKKSTIPIYRSKFTWGTYLIMSLDTWMGIIQNV